MPSAWSHLDARSRPRMTVRWGARAHGAAGLVVAREPARCGIVRKHHRSVASDGPLASCVELASLRGDVQVRWAPKTGSSMQVQNWSSWDSGQTARTRYKLQLLTWQPRVSAGELGAKRASASERVRSVAAVRVACNGSARAPPARSVRVILVLRSFSRLFAIPSDNAMAMDNSRRRRASARREVLTLSDEPPGRQNRRAKRLARDQV